MKKLGLSTLTFALAAAALLLLPAIDAEAAGGPFDLTHNHYKCYRVIEHSGFQSVGVTLIDQFGFTQAGVLRPRYLCNPVSKNNEPVPDPQVHQVCYEIATVSSGQVHDVEVRNQFGTQKLKVDFAELLCLPSSKREL